MWSALWLDPQIGVRFTVIQHMGNVALCSLVLRRCPPLSLVWEGEETLYSSQKIIGVVTYFKCYNKVYFFNYLCKRIHAHWIEQLSQCWAHIFLGTPAKGLRPMREPTHARRKPACTGREPTHAEKAHTCEKRAWTFGERGSMKTLGGVFRPRIFVHMTVLRSEMVPSYFYGKAVV